MRRWQEILEINNPHLTGSTMKELDLPEHPLLPTYSLKLYGKGRLLITGFPGVGKTVLARQLIGHLAKRGLKNAYYIDMKDVGDKEAFVEWLERVVMPDIVVLDHLPYPIPTSIKALQIVDRAGEDMPPLTFLWYLRMRGEDELADEILSLKTIEDFAVHMQWNAVMLHHLFNLYLKGGGLPGHVKDKDINIEGDLYRLESHLRGAKRTVASWLGKNASSEVTFLQIAEMTGLTRQTVAKVITELENMHVINVINNNNSKEKRRKKLVLFTSPIGYGYNPVARVRLQKIHLLSIIASHLRGNVHTVKEKRVKIDLVTGKHYIFVISGEEELPPALRRAKKLTDKPSIIVSLMPTTPRKPHQGVIITPAFYYDFIAKKLPSLL